MGTKLLPDGEKPLEGWIEIAHYMGRSVRTVQRWEIKGLPVRRHSLLGLVAFRSELDAWKKSVDAAEFERGEERVNRGARDGFPGLPDQHGGADPLGSNSEFDSILGGTTTAGGVPGKGCRPLSRKPFNVPIDTFKAAETIDRSTAPDQAIGQKPEGSLQPSEPPVSSTPPLSPEPLDIHKPLQREVVSGPTVSSRSRALRLAIFAVVALCAILSGVRAFHSRTEKISGPVEVQITGFTRLTANGHSKQGPLVTNGELIYFSDFTGNSADRVQAAVGPQSGAKVVFPSTPTPDLVLTSIAPGGESLYTDWRDGGSLFFQRRRTGPILPTRETGSGGRLSPDGVSVATYLGSDLRVRDLATGDQASFELPGLPEGVTWTPDGKSLWVVVRDPVAETCSMWDVSRNGQHTKRLPFQFENGACPDAGSWTSDGRTFVFSASSGPGARRGLWMVNSEGIDEWEQPNAHRFTPQPRFSNRGARRFRCFRDWHDVPR